MNFCGRRDDVRPAIQERHRRKSSRFVRPDARRLYHGEFHFLRPWRRDGSGQYQDEGDSGTGRCGYAGETAEYAASIQKARDERKQASEQVKQAIADPKTLDDFRMYLRAKLSKA